MADTSQIRLTELSSTAPTTANTSQQASFDGDAGEEQEQSSSPPSGRKVAEAFESYPDGGFQAWLQVFCCFSILFTTVGGIYTWGVMQDALFEIGVAPSSTLSFIGSTQATLQALFAIPISRLVAVYGNRRVAIAGSLLAGLGPILAGSCSTSVPGLIITEGFMFGLGQALCFFCAATLPSHYFLRRRNLATGLVYAGAGVGGALFAVILSALVKSHGVPWAFRIIGILFTAINLPCAWMLKSRNSRVPWRRKEGQEKTKLVEWSFFKDVRFLLLLCGTALAIFPLFVPPFFLPLFGTSLGLSTSTSSLLLAGFNLASALGRIVFGLGADAMFGSVNSLVLCLFSVAISTLAIWPVASSVAPLAVFAVVNGFCAGGFFSLMPGVIATLFGSKKLPGVFSILLTFWSPGYFLGAPIAGYILQAFGGPDKGYEAFRPAIFYSGGLSLMAAVLLLGCRLKETREWRKI
ncbi:major facilitator superfamily domain-containing protein [Leucosporidium creatinivorum]|uniref:Major facilitator superfamily domain-containing protein n=1 Tax=Leucosporidium creatinivorum TaxID=106004 RepID=A0A1Y2FZ14_9BASI|nr:major facilitator superfamily domain-containing protein [Leucosporidium creatinivorum]